MNPETIDSSRVLNSREKPGVEQKIMTYDFKRPDKFSREQIGTLNIIHETFVRLAAQGFSVMLRMPVEFKIAGVDQLTYGEFIESIPPACAMGITMMSPLKGAMVMEIDPQLASAAVDRLFGGRGEPDCAGEALHFTALQRQVLSGMYQKIVPWLGEAWSHVLPASFRFGQLETNSQFARIVPPMEMVVLVMIEVRIGKAKGIMNLCFPFLTLEPVIDRLSARYWFSSIRRGPAPTNRLARDVLKTPSELVYPAVNLSLKELGDLKEGSLVRLDEVPPFLRMGGQIVLTMERKKEGRRLCFEALGRTEAGEFLENGDKPEEDPIESALGEIRSRMDLLHKELGGKITDLEERQDKEEDELLLGLSAPSGPEPAGFDFIGMNELPALFPLLDGEHDQIIAFLLSRLEPAVAAALLNRFDPDSQTALAERVCRIERLAPELINETASLLREQFSSIDTVLSSDPEGASRVAEILNHTSRAVEKNIIETFEKTNPDLAEEIKKRMFVFEDIVLLDEKVIKLIYERVDRQDLLLAMKSVEDLVRNHIYSQLNEKESSLLASELENLGRVRISEVDRAQQKIIELIKEMEENGEITISRSDDETVD